MSISVPPGREASRLVLSGPLEPGRLRPAGWVFDFSGVGGWWEARGW